MLCHIFAMKSTMKFAVAQFTFQIVWWFLSVVVVTVISFTSASCIEPEQPEGEEDASSAQSNRFARIFGRRSRQLGELSCADADSQRDNKLIIASSIFQTILILAQCYIIYTVRKTEPNENKYGCCGNVTLQVSNSGGGKASVVPTVAVPAVAVAVPAVVVPANAGSS